MPRYTDAIVIGGGLHGCSAALHLARAGIKATVLEKNYVARHASGVNAGGVRTLYRKLPEVPLALASLELWRNVGTLVDDDCGFESHGQFRVAETEADVSVLKAREASMRELGYTHERWMDAHELFQKLPALARHCLGALAAENDGAANPFRTTVAFRRKAEALGASIREGVRANLLQPDGPNWRVTTDADDFVAPLVVNCGGAWGDRIAAQLGEPVPLEPVAPMMSVTFPMPRFLRSVVIGAGRRLSFKQMPNGTVLIGGGVRARVDRDLETTELNFRALAMNVSIACELFPIMRGATLNRTWAGIEGFMPDEMGVIGPSSTSAGVFHSFGFSTHGFELGPIVGQIIAELVTTGRSALPIEPLGISRFARPGSQAANATATGT